VFEHWKLLSGWIEEEKDFFALLKKVELHFEDWKLAKEEKKNEALLGGLLLEEALKVKERLGDELKDFVEKSDKFFKKTKRKRKLSYIVMSSAIALFGAFGFVQAKKAEEKAVEAKKSEKIAKIKEKEAKQNEQKALKRVQLLYKNVFEMVNLFGMEKMMLLSKQINDNEFSKIVEMAILLRESKAIETIEEKKKWENMIVNAMHNEEQIDKLHKILVNERIKLNEIEIKYAKKRMEVRKKFLKRIYIRACDNNHSIGCLNGSNESLYFKLYDEAYKFLQRALDLNESIIHEEKYLDATLGLLKGLQSKDIKKAKNMLNTIHIPSCSLDNLKTYVQFVEIAQKINPDFLTRLQKEQPGCYCYFNTSIKLIEYAKSTEVEPIYGLKQFLPCALKYDKNGLSYIYGNLSWYYLIERDYRKALDYAQKALTLDPSQKWIETNLAHALLLLGKKEKAKMIYLKHIGETVDNESWEDIILEDISTLKENNITSPYFDEIIHIMETRKQSKSSSSAPIVVPVFDTESDSNITKVNLP